MLTDKQQKIISDLTTEFTKINKPIPTTSGGLINKSLMDKKFEDTRSRKAEIEAINKSVMQSIHELMDRDMERLNQDLIPMGFIATRNESTTDGSMVRIDPMKKQNDNNTLFWFMYHPNSEYVGLADGSGMTKHVGFGYIKYPNIYTTNTFKSIDALCKDAEFTKRIEGMYLQTLKNKN